MTYAGASHRTKGDEPRELTSHELDLTERLVRRRRRFTDEEKRHFLELASQPGSSFSDVAERYGLALSLLFRILACRRAEGSRLPATVVEATHMLAAILAQASKTDRNDARGIAHKMRLGWYKAVHVKSAESQRLRVLLSNRRILKRKLIDIENHIRGTLRAFGLKMGRIGRSSYEVRVSS